MPDHIAQYLAGLAVVVIGFFLRHHFTQIYGDMSKKASKDEVRDLRQELRDVRDAHMREMERVERSINDRLTSMERNFDSKIELVLQTLRQAQR